MRMFDMATDPLHFRTPSTPRSGPALRSAWLFSTSPSERRRLSASAAALEILRIGMRHHGAVAVTGNPCVELGWNGLPSFAAAEARDGALATTRGAVFQPAVVEGEHQLTTGRAARTRHRQRGEVAVPRILRRRAMRGCSCPRPGRRGACRELRRCSACGSVSASTHIMSARR